MRWIKLSLVMALVLSADIGRAQAPAKRVALIVANINYASYPELPNAAIDAELIHETLTRAGFLTVQVKTNVGTRAFREAMTSFRSAAAGADIALLYYAGHAVEVAGRNWLIPSDARLQNDADLSAQAIDAAQIFSIMEGAKVKIAVLDACRENPFERRLQSTGARGVRRGLGAPTGDSGLAALARDGGAAQGVLLMYSAAPGRVAEDGVPGEGSPFARAFQRHFAEADSELRIAIGNISDAVATETQNRQLPFSTLSLSGLPIILVNSADIPAPRAPTTRSGETFKECDVCPEMVVIPAGSFLMGSPETEVGRERHEGPQRRVTIGQPFAVGKFEVTFAQWDACVAAGECAPPDDRPYHPPDQGWGRDNRPVINVSWQDAKLYVRFLNRRLGGKAYRLLSEAEWEYAARAGTTTAFSTGPAITPTQAQYAHTMAYGESPVATTSPNRTAPVGSFPENALNLHDMHGNVWEWVEDCYKEGYYEAPTDGSALHDVACRTRVIRGGSGYDNPYYLRSANRASSSPGSRGSFIGFRIARTL